jgi:predicted SnoaL-like aldol condensation-catalyzing enzyme
MANPDPGWFAGAVNQRRRRRMPRSFKEKVAALQRSIETGDPEPVSYINGSRYKQHNLNIGDGLAPIRELHNLLPKDTTRALPIRAIQDGNIAAVHVEYDLWGPKAGLDIHRFEDGLIVEHWDNLQDLPSQPNLSGHTMLDGETEVVDLDQTDANKHIIQTFVEDVLLKRDFTTFATFFINDELVQHDPGLADGAHAWLGCLAGQGGIAPRLEYLELHMLLGEGNFVLTVCEAARSGEPVAVYDLFRIAGGVIAEHWSVVEVIPPRSEWKNDNGKF